MNFSILTGDVVEVLPTLEPNSFDAALCDPPYGLEFMGKEWDRFKDTSEAGQSWNEGADWKGVVRKRPGRLYLRSHHDTCQKCRKQKHQHDDSVCTPDYIRETHQPRQMQGLQRWAEAWATELLRVLKPGAMLLACGGTRTHHRLMCALEDAGFEIRDTLCWLYGSGFPKSLDISKALDKAAGAERTPTLIPTKPGNVATRSRSATDMQSGFRDVSDSVTDEARRWSGYGTALKPAWEPCIVAMKPLDGTFANNAQKWGVAGINVDGSRIHTAGSEAKPYTVKRLKPGATLNATGGNWRPDDGPDYNGTTAAGRWPANVILDHDAARQLDQMSLENGIHGAGAERQGPSLSTDAASSLFLGNRPSPRNGVRFGDSGGASRFFFTAKVSTAEREGSDHPTMKPIDLTRYLAKLILPPQRETPRRILVPFAGVGSEMIGAILAGWDEVVGIEKDEKYAAKARERIIGTAPLFLSDTDDETEVAR